MQPHIVINLIVARTRASGLPETARLVAPGPGLVAPSRLGPAGQDQRRAADPVRSARHARVSGYPGQGRDPVKYASAVSPGLARSDNHRMRASANWEAV